MLVWKRRKRNGWKLAGFQPMHGGGIYSHCLLRCDIWSILQVVMLSLLNMSKNVKPRSQVSSTDSGICHIVSPQTCLEHKCLKIFTIPIQIHMKLMRDTDLLCFQPKSGQTPKIFATNSFVNSCSSSNTFPIIMCHIGPPISFWLDITQDHVLNRNW